MGVLLSADLLCIQSGILNLLVWGGVELMNRWDLPKSWQIKRYLTRLTFCLVSPHLLKSFLYLLNRFKDLPKGAGDVESGNLTLQTLKRLMSWDKELSCLKVALESDHWERLEVKRWQNVWLFSSLVKLSLIVLSWGGGPNSVFFSGLGTSGFELMTGLVLRERRGLTSQHWRWSPPLWFPFSPCLSPFWTKGKQSQTLSSPPRRRHPASFRLQETDNRALSKPESTVSGPPSCFGLGYARWLGPEGGRHRENQRDRGRVWEPPADAPFIP